MPLIVGLHDGSAIAFFFAFQNRVFRTARRFVCSEPDIALPLNLLHLFVLQVRLRDEQPRHTYTGHQQEDDLHGALSRVKLRFRLDYPRSEHHADEHVEERRRLRGRLAPINGPLVQDADNEIAENGLQEDHLRDKVGPDVGVPLETNVVGNLKTDRESHLHVMAGDQCAK